ncbi:MAG: NAD-dependent epimerase/dehydratase family protein [Deltaproteobacteria bacterium]|nr:NAD-dependent epimerase/dehydratase family protein [Deltaproteobacteria bacterium]
MSGKTALVTGASGFIGSNLCKRLASEGWNVRGLIRKTSSREFLDGLDVTLCEGTVGDPGSLAAAADGADMVFHLAARPPDWGSLEVFRKDNVEGTRNVLEACVAKGVRRVFHMSSLSVHPFSGHVDTGEDAPFVTPEYVGRAATFGYCQAKAEAETLAFDFARERGLELSAARTGMAYGPNDHGIFYQLAEGIRKGLYSHVGGGNTYMPWCYVENLLDGIVLASTLPGAIGRVYNVVDDGKVTMRDFVEKTCDALGWKRPRFSVPLAFARFTGAALEDLYLLFGAKKGPPITRYRIAYVAKHLHFSNERVKRELGWEPRVSLEEGLERTAAWYLRYTGKAAA